MGVAPVRAGRRADLHGTFYTMGSGMAPGASQGVTTAAAEARPAEALRPLPRRRRALRRLVALLLRSHYRRVEVDGRANVPAHGAALLVANHQNSLVDWLALEHASPRPASPLAKAPLWKERFLRPFLDAVAAVPVYRPQDAAENEGRSVRDNLDTFRACRERLAAGGAVMLFPEGVSQPRPRLLPLRTGAARIALDAGVPVSVVPVGLSYDPPTRARRGSLLVRFGEPIVVDGAAAPARRRAIVDVTRRVEEALRGLLVEADSQGDLATLRALRRVWDAETGAPPPRTLAEEDDRVRRLARVYRDLHERDPALLEALRADADSWLRVLEAGRVPPEAIDARYGAGDVARHLLSGALHHLVATPLGLVGGVVTWPARAVAEVLSLRTSRASEDVWVLGRIASNLVVFPVYVVLATVVAAVIGGPLAGIAAFVGLPLLLAVHVAWRDARDRAKGRSHAFLLLAGRRFRADLRRRRRALHERLVLAARRVASP
jgi:1-acyl-sn-glycerol-3-phosphate acyltransferase